MMKNINRKIIAITLAITSVTTTAMMPASAAWSSTPFTFTTGTYTYQGFTNEQRTNNNISTSTDEWYPEALFGSYEEYKSYINNTSVESGPTLVSGGNNNYGARFENYTKTPYQYNALTKQEKTLYKNIMKYIGTDKNEIKIAKGVTNKQIQNVINTISKYGCGESFEYYEDTRSLKFMRYKPNKLFVEFAEEIEKNFPQKASDYDKVKVIHDEICRRYKYGDKDLGVKTTLTAEYLVCAGYTNLFEDLCKYFNINCTTTGSKIHSWNKVMIDGEWYNIDVCADDKSKISYRYFLVSDSKLTKLDSGESHRELSSNKVPKSTKSYSKK